VVISIWSWNFMKLPHRRQFLHLTAGAAALPTTLSLARAQTYPTRPITLIVPFAAGGATDVVGRILRDHLSNNLGQQVIIENVGGAGGMTGTSRVAKAAPDGYTIVLGNTGTHAHNQTLYKNPLYNSAIDFAPVALIVDLPTILTARANFPADNLPEFVAYAKTNGAKMQYGSAGAGSSTHLACALLNAAVGIKVAHIPYRGGAPALQDLIGGRLDYQCITTASAKPLTEAKQLKAIANLAKNRSPIMPAVATAQEQGVKDFEADFWVAIFLPKGTPDAIVRRLNAATAGAMTVPSVQERMTEIGAELVAPERRSPEYLQTFVASQIEKWAGPIKASGVSMD
jgi:tripartite-type tricarboxylate transporter receptor subunit TctC